jgi:hypothetical protein
MLAGFYSVSIAAVHRLCNASIRLRTARRFTLRELARRLKAFERGNRTQDVNPVIATLTTHGLEQQKGKHASFEKAAWT